MIPAWFPAAIGGVVVAGTIGGAAYGGFLYGASKANAACAQQQDTARSALQKRYDRVAKDYESLKKRRQAAAKVVEKEIIREIQEKPVYRECRVPADGVRLLNDARRGGGPASGAGKPAGPLPGDISPQ